MYESIPWTLAHELGVFRIDPLPKSCLDFFPGQRGFAGADVPTDGIMVVANNFSTVKGFDDYSAASDAESKTPTWRRLRLIMRFDRVFAECVVIMQPRLVVALGAAAAKYPAADPERAEMQKVDVRTPNGALSAETLVTAIVPHPSAWVGATNAYFEAQGRRIGNLHQLSKNMGGSCRK